MKKSNEERQRERWLERDRKVSTLAKAKENWYVIKEESWDPVSVPEDTLEDAIERAVRELTC